MLVSGRTITEIAERLNLSVKTVSTHKARVLQKMNMDNAAELVRYAIKHRLVDDPDLSC
jgi:DNA-binding NarL/FixJ family response regulator